MAKFDETPIVKDPAVRRHAAPAGRCVSTLPAKCAASPASQRTPPQSTCPPALCPNWQDKAIEKFGELLDKNKALRVYMDICVRCGACTDKCQFYLGTGDPQNFPVARAELMRKVYRRYFTPGGRYAPGSWTMPPTSTKRCSRSGTPTSTSAPSAGAARSFARMASTPPRSPWLRARSWPPSASRPSTSPRW